MNICVKCGDFASHLYCWEYQLGQEPVTTVKLCNGCYIRMMTSEFDRELERQIQDALISSQDRLRLRGSRP